MSATRRHAGRALGSLAVALAIAPAAAHADTYTVVADDATSLKSALTQAAAHANASGPDVVSIPAGTYAGAFSYTGDAVDVEGAGEETTKLTSAAGGSTTLELDALGSSVSNLGVENTATTWGVALQLWKGGTVQDARIAATGNNLVALETAVTTSVTRARIVLGATDSGVRTYDPGTSLTISQSTITGVGGSSRGVLSDSHGSSVHVSQLRSVGVAYPLRAIGGGNLTVRDSLLVLPKGVVASALEAGDNNNLSDSTSTLDADRVTVVGDPTAKQDAASLYANSAGDDFRVRIRDSVVTGVAKPLVCYASAGTGESSADWSSLPAGGDVSNAAACPVTRTNAVADAPIFVDAAGGDYHQRYDSPLNDAGDPAPFMPTEDLDGLARPVGRVDLGAYEYQRRPPVVSVTAAPDAPAPGQDVTFAATASDPDPGDSPLAYAWSFDDGATATGPTATHAFGSAGTHAATVTVTDPSNTSASATAAVTITGPGSGNARDLTAPIVTLHVKHRLSLAKALRHGIPATVGCSEACSYKATLVLDVGRAKRLRVGTRNTSLAAAGTRTVAIKLTRKGSKALRRLGHAKLDVRASATDHAGNMGRARPRRTTVR